MFFKSTINGVAWEPIKGKLHYLGPRLGGGRGGDIVPGSLSQKKVMATGPVPGIASKT